MATLDLRLEHIESVESSIHNAVTELRRRNNDYESIIKDINNIASSSSNLSNSNIYLKKKNSLLQGKMDKLNSFKNKVTDFSTNAKEADSRVATYVTDQSDIFYKTVGIKTGWSADWENFKKDCKNVKKIITEFYEKHKYYIDFVVDRVFLLVAVVSFIAAIPTGGATLFFAGFALSQCAGDVLTSSIALEYHLVGDDEKAGAWAKRGLKDVALFLGDGIDKVAELITGKQTDFFRNLMGFTYNMINIGSIGYGLKNGGLKVFKSFKEKTFLGTSLKTTFGMKDISATAGSMDTFRGWQAISEVCNISVGSAAKLNVATNWVKNIKQSYKIADSLIEGNFFTEGIKVVKDIKGMYKPFNDGLRNFQQMFDINGIHPYVMKYGI